MAVRGDIVIRTAVRAFLGLSVAATFATPVGTAQQTTTTAAAVTFTKDIAPLLQRSCQSCHRPDSIAPMSLLTYEDARPYAASIKRRTAIRNRQGTMPPWYIEKDLGIQHYKNDISLSDDEMRSISALRKNNIRIADPPERAPKWDVETVA